MESEGSITELLAAWRDGEPDALDALMPFVVDELERIARARLRREHASDALEPLALVNEAYIRLAGERSASFTSRAHFLGAAAEAMRRILIDHARRRAAAKRSALLVTFDDLEVVDPGRPRPLDLIALDDALRRLESLAPRQGKVVELRFYGGLSSTEVAEVLGVSERTVRRDWTTARAWLYRELTVAA